MIEDTKAKEIIPHYALFAGIASVITVFILIVFKTYVYFLSGSVSVLASLIDSMVDAGVSIMTLLAIKVSLKPPDEDHRHGHGKAEGLAALFQSAFIAGAGVFLLLESLQRFGNAHMVTGHQAVIWVMVISIAASVVLIIIQKLSLLKAPSLAVEADSAHYSTDLFLNGGVIVVMLLLQNGAPGWIDPLFSVMVVVLLGWTAFHIAKKAVDMLLDRELPEAVRQRIEKIVMEHPEVLGIHDLRTYRSGMKLFISFDIEMDPSFLLYTAHEYAMEVEQAVLADYPHAEIMIHVDPLGVPPDSRHNDIEEGTS